MLFMPLYTYLLFVHLTCFGLRGGFFFKFSIISALLFIFPCTSRRFCSLKVVAVLIVATLQIVALAFKNVYLSLLISLT